MAHTITVESWESHSPWCPVCDSEEYKALGTLERKLYLRCRNCGLDYAVDAADYESEE